MQIMTKRIGALVLAACLLAVLAFGGVMAWAAGTWWPEDNTNSLTVTATNQEAHKADIVNANVVADVIPIADAVAQDESEAFDYNLVAPFNTEELDGLLKKAYSKDGKASDWQALADAAAKLATLKADGDMVVTDASAGTITETLSGQSDGLYLVIAHGKGITAPEDGAYVAYSNYYDYSFQPTIVAMPGKDAVNPSSSETHPGDPSTDYGNWTNEVAISMKTERTPALGSLRITKEVIDFAGEKATFTFHIVGKTLEGEDYENYAAIYYDEQTDTTIGSIPAGTEVTVTEEYEGARYQLESVDPTDGKATIISDRAVEADEELEIATVGFVNKPNGNDVPGHGIENRFTAQDDGDWEWHSTPAQAAETTK